MAEETKTPSKRLERIYTVPFRRVYNYIHTRRTRRAMVMLRAFLARHFKVKDEVVRISAGVNDAMWRDGMQKPPRKLKIRGVLDNGRLTAWMMGEEEANKKLADEKKALAEKAKKEAESKKNAAAKKEEKRDEKKADTSTQPKTAEKKADAKPAAEAAKPAEAKAAVKAAQNEPRANEVKPMPKQQGGATGGRNQI